MNAVKCVFVRRLDIPSLQWNLTTATIRAITVTKTQAAAPIAAWMKLTLKHTLYGHLGVMQVNEFNAHYLVIVYLRRTACVVRHFFIDRMTITTAPPTIATLTTNKKKWYTRGQTERQKHCTLFPRSLSLRSCRWQKRKKRRGEKMRLI